MVWFDVAGWLGALLTAGAYSMRNMKWLRIVAVGANLSFITYGFAASVWPMLVLHLFLLPLNLFRLMEITRASARLHLSRYAPDPLAPLKPFLKRTSFDEGHVLFQKGDTADRVYVVEEGEVGLPELGKSLGPGALIGEVALFDPSRSRTASAICKTPCRLATIDEVDFMRLFHQSPEFGVYILRLVADRLFEDRQAVANRSARFESAQ